MIYVPEKLQPKHPFKYPSDNECEFERWYFDNYDYQPEEREYLPVFWTGYYCKYKFGQDLAAMNRLQHFLNTLDRSLKYYTIIQYDNGILHHLSGLDIKVFSMSGGRTDYPLPLISQQHDYKPHSYIRRCFTASFVGKLTHPIRKEVIGNMPTGDLQYFISSDTLDLNRFCQLLCESTFTLCPRGFGPTSFRIQEALQYGSIPVYISDQFVIPHNVPFTDYGVLIDARDAHRVHEILSDISAEEIKRKQKVIPEIYQKYFTYQGNKALIQSSLEEPAKEGI